MQTIKITQGWRPNCPNHGCELRDLGFPMKQKGIGICPVSGAKFDFESSVDGETMVKDKDGKMVKALNWKVEGDESVLTS